ncbi:MAG TPA: HU family DNA-binding protein [Candidatus Cryosericum sp.]|jgi:nucleoid DNA-binding protein|nr:HU family DNA-binding protein [Candidatus Cryosericum sp.]HPS70526.1 HU family DNA-binding protein [Candidatus Cryosericum sp.]
MADNILRVFVSFADDVKTEAKAAKHIVELVSSTVGPRTRIALESYLWNRDQPSDLGSGDAQSLINEEIKNCTFFVGIMATRFGSPTPRAASGMEEEYQTALHCKKARRLPMFKLAYYFSTKRVNPAVIEPAQLALVQAFKKNLSPQGLYHDVPSLGAFKEQFREDLEKHLEEWRQHDLDRRKTKSRKQIGQAMAKSTGVSAVDSYRALTTLEEVIVEAMRRNESVRLGDFGTFGVKERKAHKGVNPNTLKAITIPKKKAMFFKPGKVLKDAVAKR